MEYFFYNNDADSLGGEDRTHILIENGIAVTGEPHQFGYQLGQLSPGDMLVMYHNGKGIVAVGRVLEKWDRKSYREPIYYVFGKSFYSSDLECRIKVDWFLDLRKNPIPIHVILRRIGYQPRGTVKIIKKWRAEVEHMIAEYGELRGPSNYMEQESPIAEEIDTTPDTVIEGAQKTIIINAYERNSTARNKCISYWGVKCQVCGVILRDVYGDIAGDFIQVHHLTPIHQIGQEYTLDPIKDMRPVCPNCHAMLHRKRTPLSIVELQKSMKLGQQGVAPYVAQGAPSGER